MSYPYFFSLSFSKVDKKHEFKMAVVYGVYLGNLPMIEILVHIRNPVNNHSVNTIGKHGGYPRSENATIGEA